MQLVTMNLSTTFTPEQVVFYSVLLVAAGLAWFVGNVLFVWSGPAR